jgi:hypothetical protein
MMLTNSAYRLTFALRGGLLPSIVLGLLLRARVGPPVS